MINIKIDDAGLFIIGIIVIAYFWLRKGDTTVIEEVQEIQSESAWTPDQILSHVAYEESIFKRMHLGDPTHVSISLEIYNTIKEYAHKLGIETDKKEPRIMDLEVIVSPELTGNEIQISRNIASP